MRILYIAGNPDGARTLQIEQELNLLRERLDDTPSPETIDIRTYPNIRSTDLARTIDRSAPDVLHFSAHGNDQGIVLGHPDRGHILLDGDGLSKVLIAQQSRPKLIVINACSSRPMAAQLVGAADFVVGMDAPISNSGARDFAANLYQRLASGASVGNAFSLAAAMLGVLDGGAVNAKLFPADCADRASITFIANPLRILATLPEVDRWLDNGRDQPKKSFDRSYPEVEFGLAGAPPATRFASLFTDDSDIKRRGRQSLFDSRGWFIQAQPINGEIWFDRGYYYYGDMQWYAAVTTGERRVQSCAAPTSEALERYYFAEQWRGPIPDQIGNTIRETLDNLRANSGSRAHRRTLKSRLGLQRQS